MDRLTDSRSLDALDPAFRARLSLALDACEARGVVMVPYMTTRSPQVQARLWRQSRSGAEVQAAIAMLRAEGADWLAAVLDAVGPCHGVEVTGALPGLSWHQHALACDSYWLVGGKAEWSSSKTVGASNGYRVMREEAARVGLHLGPAGDWPHIQDRKAGRPPGSWADIDATMRGLWA